MKYCPKCKQEKPLEAFNLLKNRKYINCCKECLKIYSQQWRLSHKDHTKQRQQQYYQRNRFTLLEKEKQRLQTHGDMIRKRRNARYHACKHDGLTYYQKNKAKVKEYYQQNKTRAAEYQKQYNKRNPHLDCSYHLKKEHDMTWEQYNIILNSQKGCCAICCQPPKHIQATNGHNEKLGHLCVDHDHLTGKIRGLLCSKCNRGLGLFKDKIANIQNAINYLNVVTPIL